MSYTSYNIRNVWYIDISCEGTLILLVLYFWQSMNISRILYITDNLF